MCDRLRRSATAVHDFVEGPRRAAPFIALIDSFIEPVASASLIDGEEKPSVLITID
jgi:hypothetical protein